MGAGDPGNIRIETAAVFAPDQLLDDDSRYGVARIYLLARLKNVEA